MVRGDDEVVLFGVVGVGVGGGWSGWWYLVMFLPVLHSWFPSGCGAETERHRHHLVLVAARAAERLHFGGGRANVSPFHLMLYFEQFALKHIDIIRIPEIVCK